MELQRRKTLGYPHARPCPRHQPRDGRGELDHHSDHWERRTPVRRDLASGRGVAGVGEASPHWGAALPVSGLALRLGAVLHGRRGGEGMMIEAQAATPRRGGINPESAVLSQRHKDHKGFPSDMSVAEVTWGDDRRHAFNDPSSFVSLCLCENHRRIQDKPCTPPGSGRQCRPVPGSGTRCRGPFRFVVNQCNKIRSVRRWSWSWHWGSPRSL